MSSKSNEVVWIIKKRGWISPMKNIGLKIPPNQKEFLENLKKKTDTENFSEIMRIFIDFALEHEEEFFALLKKYQYLKTNGDD